MRVLVVDPHPALRAALCAALELEDGIRVADEAGDMLAALRIAAHTDITLAIVDSGLTGLPSPLALEGMRALARRAPVVVMGTGDPALYAAAYVEAGASGYWAKDGELAALVCLLRAAVERRSAA